MLFRIEDISGIDPKLRTYDVSEYTPVTVNKEQIDYYIASKIREEVNGSKNRNLLSYSKSLATCLLKYNKGTDNELHIYIDRNINYIFYISPNGHIRHKNYNIQDRINGNPLFSGTGEIQLLNFEIDVSDNNLLDEYLKYYTTVGKKFYASPEKDSEVVVMKPLNDFVINQYMDAVYILYALQLKYGFLRNEDVKRALISNLKNMDAFGFKYGPHERTAFIQLLSYLSVNWQYEREISEQIYNYSKNDEHFSMYYDPILQFHGIIEDRFEDAYYLSTYNMNVISDLFWEYCKIYLNHSM
ncbi:MAG: hypothetical protein K2K56_12805 [Lachnospiraceae bacterium]|nr:hypothetical protein [Lachnospiraceae bacterium]